MSVIKQGKALLEAESAAIMALSQSIGVEFEQAITWVLEATRPGKGQSHKVVTCGIGKSGHIARKATGTWNSTGTPCSFLHASEAVHGDLGLVQSGDIVFLYSQSGETDEIVQLFPSLKQLGAKTIVITGRPASSAGKLADLVLDTKVIHEACPNNLAPTTSTTVMLALSDALAIATMEARGFGREDFARLHPSGSLGKRLTLTIEDVMRPLGEIAVTTEEKSLLEVTRLITQAGVGAVCIVDASNQLVGLVSDGDFRREIANGGDFNSPVGSRMTRNVTTISPDLLAVEGLEFFQNLPKKLGELPVVKDGKLFGLVMLKDLLRSGIV